MKNSKIIRSLNERRHYSFLDTTKDTNWVHDLIEMSKKGIKYDGIPRIAVTPGMMILSYHLLGFMEDRTSGTPGDERYGFMGKHVDSFTADINFGNALSLDDKVILQRREETGIILLDAINKETGSNSLIQEINNKKIDITKRSEIRTYEHLEGNLDLKGIDPYKVSEQDIKRFSAIFRERIDVDSFVRFVYAVTISSRVLIDCMDHSNDSAFPIIRDLRDNEGRVPVYKNMRISSPNMITKHSITPYQDLHFKVLSSRVPGEDLQFRAYMECYREEDGRQKKLFEYQAETAMLPLRAVMMRFKKAV